MEDWKEYIIITPAILSHIDPRKPLCNGGGKPKAPKEAPPMTAPPREEPESGMDQALLAARRRKGLRRTVLSNNMEANFEGVTSPANAVLGTSTVLGAAPQSNKLA